MSQSTLFQYFKTEQTQDIEVLICEDSKEAYELIHVVSEHFRMKLAAELTEVKKLDDDVYWKDFLNIPMISMVK